MSLPLRLYRRLILVGLPLKPIVASLERTEVVTYLGTTAVVCVVVIVVRVLWVMREEIACRLLRRAGRAGGGRCGSSRNAAVVAWAAMRGTESLAAGLALPAGFPQRDLVLRRLWRGTRHDGAAGPHPAAAERRRLVELRNDGTIGDDAFHVIEEDLDWAELNAEAMRRRG